MGIIPAAALDAVASYAAEVVSAPLPVAVAAVLAVLTVVGLRLVGNGLVLRRSCAVFATARKSGAPAAALPENAFPAKLIEGWRELDDYPNAEEGELLGIELTDDQWETLGAEGRPGTGDKLAGYPAWVQGVEYPNCLVCGASMRLVFQIDSEDNLPFMFGDVGCGHITQCKTHPEQLAFGWACG